MRKTSTIISKCIILSALMFVAVGCVYEPYPQPAPVAVAPYGCCASYGEYPSYYPGYYYGPAPSVTFGYYGRGGYGGYHHWR